VASLLIAVSLLTYIANRIPVRNLARAESSKLVSLTADGKNRVVTTDAATVGEVLDRAGITLEKGDMVEPAASTPIPRGFFNINVYRGQLYRIVDGASSTSVRSAHQSPQLIAADAGITIYPEDIVGTTQVRDFVGAEVVGQNIIINRAKVFHVLADGKQMSLRSQKPTIGEALVDKNVPLGVQDTVEPSMGSGLVSGADVKITRVSQAVATQEIKLPHGSRTVADNTMLKGTRQVRTAGADGKKAVTYRIHYHDGVEVSRETLKVSDESAPVTEVIAVGTKVVYASEAVALAADMAGERGWVDGQWDALYALWNRESGFNPNAVNGNSGACGIPQANPCSKITDKSVGGQIKWGLDYIAGRYGTPTKAWAYWQSNHSY
jgi:uncharacterized protein YabE (DUF348 family)